MIVVELGIEICGLGLRARLASSCTSSASALLALAPSCTAAAFLALASLTSTAAIASLTITSVASRSIVTAASVVAASLLAIAAAASLLISSLHLRVRGLHELTADHVNVHNIRRLTSRPCGLAALS